MHPTGCPLGAMTHMSPLTYLNRGFIALILLVFYLCRIWVVDRFQCMSFGELRSGKTKPFMVILIGLSLFSLVVSDGIGE
jgi:hypothetical protein